METLKQPLLIKTKKSLACRKNCWMFEMKDRVDDLEMAFLQISIPLEAVSILRSAEKRS